MNRSVDATTFAIEDTIDFDAVIPRSGTDSTKWDRYSDRDVLPFWVADMDFPVAPPIHRALQARLAHPIFGYSNPPADLGEAIAAHLQRNYDWTIETDWLVYLPGVVPGLGACCRAFCGAGDEVITNPPIYHHFFDAHEPDRQTLVQVPLMLDGQRRVYDMPAMAAAITDRTRLLMMCTPHNPVGTVFTRAELQRLGDLCEQHDLVMVSDEIHCDLVVDPGARHVPTAVACAGQADRIVTLMSASKTWNIAGLNCSYAVISNADLRQRFREACASTIGMVPPLAYIATLAAYRDGGAWRRDLLAYLAGNLAYLEAEIADIPGLVLRPLQATYLAWIDASSLGLDDAQAYFEEHGVGLSAGEQFGEPGFLRLNFACPRQTLVAGVQRMAKAVAALGR